MRLELEIPSTGIHYLMERAEAHGRTIEAEALAALEELWSRGSSAEANGNKWKLSRYIAKAPLTDNWGIAFDALDKFASEDLFPPREQPKPDTREWE